MKRVSHPDRPAVRIAMALAVGALVVGLVAIAVLVFLTARQGAPAPTEPGVCWRADPKRAAPAFAVAARGVASLDDCAAVLEAIHVQGAPRADGAFQGYFIFVDAREVASATGMRGFHYPIFQPAQRREIDADLRDLIRERDGRLPAPGDLAVERK
ncbi:MAG: hypothetical protein M3T55_03660 [Pseudomonadota bacterium]|nr:hypothetical protein [Pseudomonadota bacterium]